MIEVKIEAGPGPNVRRVVSIQCTTCMHSADDANTVQYRASADIYRPVFGTVSGRLGLGHATVGDEEQPILFCVECGEELPLPPEVDALAHCFDSGQEFAAAVEIEKQGDTFRTCTCSEATLANEQIRWRMIGQPAPSFITFMEDSKESDAESTATPSIRGWFRGDALVLRCPCCDGSLLRKVCSSVKDAVLAGTNLKESP